MHRPAALLLGAVIAALFGLGGLLQASQALNHDVGWLIVAARRMVDGASVYAEDVVEVNPPLILALYAPSIWIARAFDIGEIAAFRSWTAIAIALSVGLCARALRSLLESDTGSRHTLIATITFSLWLPFHASYGQREHWIVLALLPYLIAAAARAAQQPLPARWAALAGLAGGIGLAIKPHYALVFVAVEAVVAWSRRSLRAWRAPDVGVAGAFGAVYLGCTALWIPSYFDFIIPLARDAYWAFRKPLVKLFAWDDLAVLAAVVWVGIACGATPGRRALLRVLCVAAGAAYAAHLIQRVGWPYHRIPFGCLAIVSLGVAVADGFGAWRAGTLRLRSPRGIATGLGTLALAAACVVAFPTRISDTLAAGAAWRSGGATGKVKAFTRAIGEHAPGGTVYFFSSGLRWSFPVVNHAQVGWTSRFPSLWLLPSVLRARRDPGVSEALASRLLEHEQYLIDAVVEDFERRPPDLVFVDVAPVKRFMVLTRFEYLPYFLEDARFRQIWSRYQPLGGIDTYAVYRRITPRSPGRAAAPGPR